MDESKKDIINDQRIRWDLKRYVHTNLYWAILLFVACVLINILYIYIFSKQTPTGFIHGILGVCAISFFMLLIISTIFLIHCIIYLTSIQKLKFNIKIDEFTHQRELWYPFMRGPILHLCFKCSGDLPFYKICSNHRGELYDWSENYTMTVNDLMQITTAGEQFYLINVNGKRLHHLYPTRYFRYVGDKTVEDTTLK